MTYRFALLLFLLLATTPLFAQDVSTWEKVLLPAWTPEAIHGADGSQFQTVFDIQAHDQPVRVYPTTAPGTQNAVIGTVKSDVGNPDDTVTIAGRSPAGGRLLYVEPGGTARLSFGYSLIAVARDATAYYAALPVVRARDFSTSDVTIQLVPTWPILGSPPNKFTLTGYRQRHALYVYDVDNTGTLHVQVTWGIQDQTPRAPGGIVAVTSRDADDPTYPYYVRINLDELVPPCYGIAFSTDCDAFVRTIRVRSLTPGVHFWAFVATTDNRTQAVTIEAPQ